MCVRDNTELYMIYSACWLRVFYLSRASFASFLGARAWDRDRPNLFLAGRGRCP